MPAQHSINSLSAGASLAPAPGTRERIITAAADLMKAEPGDFSVQRVARHAGFSARAIYGHFESGTELALHARLLTLQQLTCALPIEVRSGVTPLEALRQFAFHMSAAIRTLGAMWLMSSRKDPAFRTEYRRAVRGRLVAQVEQYLLGLELEAPVNGSSCGDLAEWFVTMIESLTINHEAEFALQMQLEDSIDWTVQSFALSNGLCSSTPAARMTPIYDAAASSKECGRP